MNQKASIKRSVLTHRQDADLDAGLEVSRKLSEFFRVFHRAAMQTFFDASLALQSSDLSACLTR